MVATYVQIPAQNGPDFSETVICFDCLNPKQIDSAEGFAQFRPEHQILHAALLLWPCPSGRHRRPAPHTFGMFGCSFVAWHLSGASMEFLEVLCLNAQLPQSLLEPLGVIFEALESS